jgi:transposase InsO family protein
VLRNEGIIVSEKVIRRLMKEENLIVKGKRKKKYSSCVGEITPAPENLLERDFHADRPNTKWLTDITEMTAKDG